MKRFLLLFTVLVGFSLMSVNAQTYKINRLNYDYRMYVPEFGDPYDPTLMGVCSFFIPGLGQMISGEVGRGLSFLGGYVATVLVTGFSTVLIEYGEPYIVTLVGLAGALGFAITSTIDAVKVAKVNNLYIRDYRKSNAFHLEFAPYIGQFNTGNQIVTPVGMSMRISF